MNLRILVALAVVLVLAGGCTKSADIGTSSSSSGHQRILRRGNGGEPQTLDPALAEDDHAFNVLADLYEGLVIESGDGSLIAGVAQYWEISADGRQYTFHLRPDAVWSNGEPVTASQFVAGVRRVLSPGTTAAYSFLLEPILNYRLVIDGQVPVSEIGVHAPDEKTLVIDLQSPAPYFLGVLAMPIAYPRYSEFEDNSLRYRDPEHFIGNGPYVLEEWSIGEVIRLVRNKDYRNAANVQIGAVEYLPIADPVAEMNIYRAGELDITATVPVGSVARLRETRSAELRVAPSLALYYLAFDLSEPPFDNRLLRQALTMAIDRRALVAVLGRGEQGAFGLVPPGVANHDSARYSWQTLSNTERESKARELFRQAGYGDAGKLQLHLTYDTGDIHEKVALVVTSMWTDVLGVDVELEKKEWKYFLATRDDRSAWQVMRFAWTGDYNEASTFTDLFRADSEQNLPDYRNEKYDLLLDKAREMLDPTARAAKMAKAEELLINDYPIAPLYFYVSKHLVSQDVQNFRQNVLDRHPTQFLQLKPAQQN